MAQRLVSISVSHGYETLADQFPKFAPLVNYIVKYVRGHQPPGELTQGSRTLDREAFSRIVVRRAFIVSVRPLSKNLHSISPRAYKYAHNGLTQHRYHLRDFSVIYSPCLDLVASFSRLSRTNSRKRHATYFSHIKQPAYDTHDHRPRPASKPFPHTLARTHPTHLVPTSPAHLGKTSPRKHTTYAQCRYTHSFLR